MRVLWEGLKGHWAVFCKGGKQDEKEGINIYHIYGWCPLDSQQILHPFPDLLPGKCLHTFAKDSL